MNIRTFDDLSDRLSAELAWRKKELSILKYFLDLGVSDAGRRRVLGRCGITILYAHWEGFVKLASRHYLEYVAMQRLKNDELNAHMLAMSLRTSVQFDTGTRKYSEYGKIVDFFQDRLESRARLPFKKGLSTESNLSSSVLKEILWCLDVDYSHYATKEKFIDSRLLARRNHVAHGEEMNIDPDEFDEMRGSVVDMMTILKTELENSAIMKRFRRTEN